jgi:hypothetical protein
MRKKRTLPVLSAQRIATNGTEIELMPKARPPGSADLDPNLFRARIADTSGLQDSIRWAFDGQTYSLSEITRQLVDRHGARWLRSRTFCTWRIVSHDRSMWDEAEDYPR